MSNSKDDHIRAAEEALEAITSKWRKDIKTKDPATIERRIQHYLDFQDLRQQDEWIRMVNSIIRDSSELIARVMSNLTIPGSDSEDKRKSRLDEFYRYPLEYGEEQHRHLNELVLAFLAKVARTPWPEDFVGSLCFDEAEDYIGDDQILDFAGFLMMEAWYRLKTTIEIACELPKCGLFGGDLYFDDDITDLTRFQLLVLQRASAQIRPIWPITVDTDAVNRAIDANSESIKQTGSPIITDLSSYRTAERHMITHYARYHMDQNDLGLMHRWMAE
ncbi:hypothetical protein [Croceicoccus gelatinilyticus]|uniref:hypothetical protein n=1 Tax=Croceicoccus gelatinilyticus TaxID=2835536 RepID=UPI001BCB7AA2|nr:hypothetical protein [Croceicoccus gelatinilyticus]MBS7671525.1 hypothetical protein [Croceicoccus gelatinilyticus]